MESSCYFLRIKVLSDAKKENLPKNDKKKWELRISTFFCWSAFGVLPGYHISTSHSNHLLILRSGSKKHHSFGSLLNDLRSLTTENRMVISKKQTLPPMSFCGDYSNNQRLPSRMSHHPYRWSIHLVLGTAARILPFDDFPAEHMEVMKHRKLITGPTCKSTSCQSIPGRIPVRLNLPSHTLAIKQIPSHKKPETCVHLVILVCFPYLSSHA